VALVVFCAEKQPDLLVLLGPFVDSLHPSIAAGHLPCTFSQLFLQEVRAPAVLLP
jgi:hypothetical protein